jgi:pimeloyl-ACP methyl ester carboxylesterase
VLEKEDLARILDREREGPIVLIGSSLGGAVALEEAARDPRISLVVAIAPFSDLRTLELERAPWYTTSSELDDAFRIADEESGARLETACPASAAPEIRCPVLLVHGSADQSTPPSHSDRILQGLTGRKRLLLEPGHGHHDPLDPATWDAIDEAVLAIAHDAGAGRPH